MKRPVNLSPDVIHLIWSCWRKGDEDEDSILLRILQPHAPSGSSTVASLDIREHVALAQTQNADVLIQTASSGRSATAVSSDVKDSLQSGNGKIRWVDDVVVALRNLGGEADLSAIYKEVEGLRRRAGRSIIKSLDATIRQTIEAHSRDSDNYREGNTDYFSWVERGRWKLK